MSSTPGPGEVDFLGLESNKKDSTLDPYTQLLKSKQLSYNHIRSTPKQEDLENNNNNNSNKNNEKENGEKEEDNDEDLYIDPKAAITENDLKKFDVAAFIQRQVSFRVEEYVDTRSLNVWTGSWNVNAKKAQDPKILKAWLLYSLLPANNIKKVYKAPDLFVIAFQEIVDLNAANFLVDHSACGPWEAALKETLNILPDNSYTLIAETHLVGLALFIFANDKIVPNVRDVRTTTVGTGIMGVGGNKGGVIARLAVYESSYCFINSHLAAHQTHVSARNADYHNICRRAMLIPGGVTISSQNSNMAGGIVSDEMMSVVSSGLNRFADKIANLAQRSTRTDAAREREREKEKEKEKERVGGLGIFEHDYVFWLGDNNYRLNIDLDPCYKLIGENAWDELLKFDQLVIERNAGRAFKDFIEGDIDFPPTYKYITGTNQYDRRESGKMRVPAYCDRIMYKGEGIKQRFYTRAELTQSDHKPVLSLFKVPMRIQVDKKKKRIIDQLKSLSPKQLWPKIGTSHESLDFGVVSYDIPVTREVLIKNLGSSVVVYKLLYRRSVPVLSSKSDPFSSNYNADSDNEDEHHQDDSQANENDLSERFPSWLRVSPSSGTLSIGSSGVLTVKLHVNRMAASRLNTIMNDSAILSDLVIRMSVGKVASQLSAHHSIPILGTYARTILSTPLTHLNRLPSPIRVNMSGDSLIRYSIPRSIFTLFQYCITGNITSISLTQAKLVFKVDKECLAATWEDGGSVTYKNNKDVRDVIECLDTGKEIPPETKLSIIIKALRVFFHSLPNPIMAPSGSGTSIVLNESDQNDSSVNDNNSLSKKKNDKVAEADSEESSDDENENNSSNGKSKSDMNKSNGPSDKANNNGSSNGTTAMVPEDLSAWCNNLLMTMTSNNYKLFITFVSFAREVVKGIGDKTPSFALQVSSVFASSLCHKVSNVPWSETMSISPVDILLHFITSPDFE